MRVIDKPEWEHSCGGNTANTYLRLHACRRIAIYFHDPVHMLPATIESELVNC